MPSKPSEPRTLTQMLREWDDESLTSLFRLRPELAFPAPTEFSQLASRATTRHSVAAALDRLTSAELAAARLACAADPPFALADVAELAGVESSTDAAALEQATTRLLEQGLLWGSEHALRPVRALVGLVGPDDANTPRGGLSVTPPDLTSLPSQRPALIDKAAAGSAFEFVSRVEVVAEHSEHRPARLTQSGGLASRDVRALAQLLDVPPALAAAHLELALVAGLLGLTAHGLDEALIPTRRFDEWRADELAGQWRTLADAWLWHHLGSGPADLKQILVAAFGDPAQGRVVAAADLRGWLAWHRPRRPASWDRAIPAFVSQSAAIGLTGLGALASFAVEPAASTLTDLMPERVDRVLLQADLTAIAPGPLHPDVAAELAALADVESRGGATVFRFTRESMSRARALGWTADDIVETLHRRSRTAVPQPLEYLARDLEREPAPAIGTVGSARASDDTDPDAHGRRHPRRAAEMLPSDDPTPADRLDDDAARAVVRGLREHDGEPHETVDAGPYSESLGSTPLVALREAVETQEVVWLGFVDGKGGRHERMAVVASVDDGAVRGRDATSGDALKIPVSRVVAAHIIRTAASR
jgi:hypothetical protein